MTIKTPKGTAPTTLELAVTDSHNEFSTAVRYVLLYTTAPIDYDNFGLVPLTNFSEGRLVLMPEQHVNYYVERVSSGWHSAHPSDLVNALYCWSYLEKKLWQQPVPEI